MRQTDLLAFEIAILESQLDADEVPMSRVDDMLHRILRTAFAAGVVRCKRFSPRAIAAFAHPLLGFEVLRGWRQRRHEPRSPRARGGEDPEAGASAPFAEADRILEAWQGPVRCPKPRLHPARIGTHRTGLDPVRVVRPHRLSDLLARHREVHGKPVRGSGRYPPRAQGRPISGSLFAQSIRARLLFSRLVWAAPRLPTWTMRARTFPTQ
jgi:hypothetical protein